MIDSCAAPNFGMEIRGSYHKHIILISKPTSSFCDYIKIDSTSDSRRWSEQSYLCAGITTNNTSASPNLLTDWQKADYKITRTVIKNTLGPQLLDSVFVDAKIPDI
jgi:hypothetical protein